MAGTDFGYVSLACLMVVVAYTILLLVYSIGFQLAYWRKKDRSAPLEAGIVLPFRNEKEELLDLLSHYRPWKAQIIFVNDHSRDITEKALDALCGAQGMQITHNTDVAKGKKAAILSGVNLTKQDWVLTTDADTRLRSSWLQQAGCLTKSPCQAVVLPVRPAPRRDAIGRFFDLEFIMLQMVGLASASLKWPLLANGAAFLFRKEAYQRSLSLRKDLEDAHGDDVFTLHAIAKYGRKQGISSGIALGYAAETKFPSDGLSLWMQRLRWIHKVPQVPSTYYSAVSWLTLLAHAVHIVAIAAILMGNTAWIWVLLLKIAAEALVLSMGVLYFHRTDCALWLLPSLLLYPFYFMTLVIAGLVVRPQWK